MPGTPASRADHAAARRRPADADVAGAAAAGTAPGAAPGERAVGASRDAPSAWPPIPPPPAIAAGARGAHPVRVRHARTACSRCGDDGDAIVVLTRPDATVDGIAELKRVLQRPLATRAVDAERFAAELARAYNAAAAERRAARRTISRARSISRG